MGLAEGDIGKMLDMLGRVDAYPHLGFGMRMQKYAQIIPSLTLERLFHRVFEIHNHCVGAAGQGLANRSGRLPGTNSAERTNGFGIT